jgi:hypothetical protein
MKGRMAMVSCVGCNLIIARAQKQYGTELVLYWAGRCLDACVRGSQGPMPILWMSWCCTLPNLKVGLCPLHPQSSLDYWLFIVCCA